METLEVGTGLVSLCTQGRFEDAIDQYYSENIVSIEGMTYPGMEKRMEGLQAIKGKTQWWIENHEVHSMEAEGPFVSEDSNQFLVRAKKLHQSKTSTGWISTCYRQAMKNSWKSLPTPMAIGLPKRATTSSSGLVLSRSRITPGGLT